MRAPARQAATTPLITSKLHPPRRLAAHIARPRLLAHLNRHRDRPLTLVCAPAGAGKSTLLSEWLASVDRPRAWVSLDERDNDPVRFASYLLAAVQTTAPGRTFTTQALLRALTPPSMAALAASLSNDLDQLDADLLLALDDYHVIANPQIDALLFELLRHPPRKLQIAVATRAEPDWPLATFRARGQLTELRFVDLQFTLDETAAFLRQALDDALDQDQVAVLHAESEGWAAGLQLMSLVVASRGGDPVVPRARDIGEDVAAYLLTEVFSDLSPLVQDRLCRLSILDRFTAPLCEAVCGSEDAAGGTEPWGQPLLDDLVRRNLFVIPLQGDPPFYRFHDLFQRYLRSQLQARATRPQIAGLHRRASAWFAEHGSIEDALEQALAGDDAAAAAALVARHRRDLYNREQFARLTRWLRLLPADVKAHDPEILLAEARIAALNWRFTEVAVFPDQAERELAHASLEPAAAALAAAELAVWRSLLEFWAGDAERVEAGARAALEALPPEATHLRGQAQTGIAGGRYLQGDLVGALAYLDAELARQPSEAPSYAWLLQTKAFLHWLDGDLTRLEQTARRLEHVSAALELADQHALAHHLLGMTHYARNDLEAAESELTKAVAARFTLRLMWWAQAAGLLALTHLARQQPEAARQLLDEARTVLLERHALRLLPHIGAFQAEADRRQGREAEAIAWAKQVELGPLVWALSAVEPQVAQARAALVQTRAGGVEQAALLVAELRAFCTRRPNRRLELEVAALEALLAERRGEHGEALAILRRLVLAAEPEGWIRLFVDLGEPMERLLRALAHDGAVPHPIARILAAFPAPRLPSPPDRTALVEPLSLRELEILALLGGSDSAKEIAAQLFISPATVKRHTLNIYRKLEVNNRRQAVARAAEFGLSASAAGSSQRDP